MELVTGHAGSTHITALQVSRLLKGVTATDESTVHRLNVDDLCALSYSDITVSIEAGEMLLNGFHVTLTDDTGGTSGEELVLDATVEETNSRIDKIVLEVIQDNTTSYQTAEIVIVQGEEAESPVAPDTPTEPDSSTQEFLAVGVIAQVTVTADAITALTDYTDLYGGNYASLTDFENIVSGIAAEYDETATYTAGQYVISDYVLYKCILESTGNDPTDTTYFETAVLSDDVQTNTTNIATNTANISATQDIVSDAWDESTTYAADDYVIHNNKLYKCLVACSGVEPPNTTYWNETTCAAEFGTISSNLTNLIQFYYNGTGYKYPLQIRYGAVSCAYATATTSTYTAFPNGLLKTIAFCAHSGFNAASTICVTADSNGSVTIRQYNTASAAMSVGYIAIGY